MQQKRSSMPLRKAGVTVLAVVMGLGGVPAVPAFAASTSELNQQLSSAQAKLDSLSQQLEIAQAKVEDTSAKIDDANAQIEKLGPEIEQQQAKVAEAQSSLASTVSDAYKNGGQSLAEMIFSSQSLADFASNIFYANKVSTANSAKIDETNKMVGELKQKEKELSDTQAELQTLLQNQQQEEAALASAQSEAESYVNGLSSELQAALKAEQEAAAKKQQEEAARAAEAAANSGVQGGSSPSGNGSSNSGSNTSSNSSNSGSNSGNFSSNSGNSSNSSSANSSSKPSNSSGSSLSGSTASVVINAARTQLGVPYSLGAMSPGVAMDCSGLTTYAYGQAGISIPHSSRSQYSLVCSRGLKKSASQLSAGDLVFYQRGGVIYHVAIYIGGGSVIHANGYGQGVVITSYDYDSGFCGGGSPV